ncbi:hypothetical protein PPOLYM_02519 [Paenibacillus polymyxa]|uniref:hypothetical protein n=1 Tax=Paenibacillus polymyxa TaxID=1406 RepID=UPI00094764B3|nr:hypothetical protein [Paenibacillus polymyxa]APQ59850.1 hypothetical protein VK72_14600 [Paenibacillus polymyxa]VUG06126.1 hypothetical protein PPOLYM_02519 [Paenibacillus polymyxa]
MIAWVIYEKRQTEGEGKYLVSNGDDFDVAYYQFDSFENNYEWYPSDMSPVVKERIAFWAVVNIPWDES